MGSHWQTPDHWGTRARCLVLSLVVLGLALALAACGSSGSSSSSSSSGGAAPTANVLKIADTGAITTWDPRASSSSESRILANFYEPLI